MTNDSVYDSLHEIIDCCLRGSVNDCRKCPLRDNSQCMDIVRLTLHKMVTARSIAGTYKEMGQEKSS